MQRRSDIAYRGAAALAGAALVTCLGLAAQPVPRQPGSPALQRVDPAIDDIGPLGMSIRNLGVDLRVPTGFDDVYRIGRKSNIRSDSGLFARVDGGVYAVFPRSVYRQTKKGLMAEIPPGTVFYIGGLPESLTAGDREAAPVSPFYADTRATTRVGDPGAIMRVRPSAGELPPGIFTSEPARKRLVHQLLKQAAAAARRPRVVLPR